MTRRLFSAWLAALLLVVSVVIPMLDSGAPSAGATLESEHDASSCVVGHDHTICTQVGANLLIASTPLDSRWQVAVGEMARVAHLVALPHRHLLGNHRSRAPPRA